MVKRLFDVACASVALVLAAPVLALAAIGIKLTAPGPVFYRARRVGFMGRSFTMFKLRTMRVEAAEAGGRITGTSDPRIFPFGQFLRRSKIDELPQLLNVLLGHMSIVGPRPEDPTIVHQFYASEHYRTLHVRPGLASPGSLYQFTHGDELLDGVDPEEGYVDRLLHMKLALDLVLLKRGSMRYDLSIIGRTLYVIAATLAGKRRFPPPPEMNEARRLLAQGFGSNDTGRLRIAAPVALFLVLGSLAVACGGDDPVRPGPVPPPPPPDTPVVMVGAGDIAECGTSTNDLLDEATALLLDTIPGIVFTLGDNAYPNGTLEEYEQCYGAGWGRHKDRTHPAAGNHEYETPGDTGATGYFAYFGAAATGNRLGYYSYDHGDWHVIVLNSGSGYGSYMAAHSPQLAWLRQDLTNSDARCTIAYWHHPRFSSGVNHGDGLRYVPVWEILYAFGVDIVLVAHEHNYERFAPQTPTGQRDDTYGIRQFVVGTGGRSYYPMNVAGPAPNSEVFDNRSSGVLVLELRRDRYDWRFVPVKGHPFSDSGSGVCHDAPPTANSATAGAAR